MIPLTEEREEDEEEVALRDMKEREARRKREEEVRLQRKAVEEADEAARLAQVKDQMKNKPFTYDSSGNIIWVQPLKTSRLPSTSPAPAYGLKRDGGPQPDGPSAAGKRPPAPGQPSRRRQEKRREVEFTDSFSRLAAQQPSMMEAMTMAPGVELSERGRTKRGAEVFAGGASGQPMTRTDYQDMVQGRGGHGSSLADGAPGGDLGLPLPVHEPSVGSPAASMPPPGSAAEGETMDGAQNVRRPHLGAELVPRPPASARPVQPAAPPTFRRAQMKRDALGFAMSTRERVATGAVSRFPNCAAQPPLGATMGHGLVPVGQKQEEYYFPQASSQNAALSLGEEASAQLGSAPAPARSIGGQIVSRNPELAMRLFPK